MSACWGVTAVAVAAAVWLLVPGRPRLAAGAALAKGRGWLLAVPPLLVATLTIGSRLLVVLAVLGAAGSWGAVLVARHRARRRASARADRVQAVCESIAAELAAGRPPGLALEAAMGSDPEMRTVPRAAELGASVPEALHTVARLDGAEDLHRVAAAWAVAESSGAGLSDSLGSVSQTIRRRRATRRLVAGELAGARAAARMMAALPVVAWLAGSGLGADPLGFLFGSLPGVACLAVGLGLSLVGTWWLEQVVSRVEGEG